MSLEEYIFVNDDCELIDGEYVVDEQAKKEYIEGATMVSMLALQGKFSFRLNDPEKPYFTHAIWITWEDEAWEGMEAKPIAEMLKKFNWIIVDANTWQLTKEFYYRKTD